MTKQITDDELSDIEEAWARLPADVRGAILMELNTGAATSYGLGDDEHEKHAAAVDPDMAAQIRRRRLMGHAYSSAVFILRAAAQRGAAILGKSPEPDDEDENEDEEP